MRLKCAAAHLESKTLTRLTEIRLDVPCNLLLYRQMTNCPGLWGSFGGAFVSELLRHSKVICLKRLPGEEKLTIINALVKACEQTKRTSVNRQS